MKPKAFYFGGGLTIRSMSGLTAILGYTYKNHDIQASYTFGTGKSSDIYWYDDNSNLMGAMNYKMSSIALKYGYQFRLLTRFGVIPQVGFAQNSLSGNIVGNYEEKYGDGASAFCMSFGLKLLAVPIQHVYVFASPEFLAPISKNDEYKAIAKTANLRAGGFAFHIGILANF